jgi:hypothetical protein
MLKLVISLAVFGALFWVAFKVESRMGLLNGKQG